MRLIESFQKTLPTNYGNPSDAPPSESNETVFEVNPENLSNPTQIASSVEELSSEDVDFVKKDTSKYRSVEEFEADFGLELDPEPAISAPPYHPSAVEEEAESVELDDEQQVISSNDPITSAEKQNTYYPTDRVARDANRSRYKGAVQDQRLEDVTDRGPERESRKVVRHQALRGETTVSLATAPAARRSARPSNPRRDALVNSTRSDRNWVTWFIVGISLTFAFYLLFF